MKILANQTDENPLSAESPELIVNSTCSICEEAWTENGNHQLASLCCGHVFGESCIQRWLNESNRHRCPICNQEASGNEIRKIFLDTTLPPRPPTPPPPQADSEQDRSSEMALMLAEELQTRCSFLESQNEELTLFLGTTNQNEQEERAKLEETIAKANSLEERVAVLTEQLQTSEAKCQSLEEQNNRINARLADVENELGEENAKCVEAADKANRLDVELQVRTVQIDGMKELLEDAEHRLEEEKTEHNKTMVKVASLEEQAAVLTELLQTFEARCESLQEQIGLQEISDRIDEREAKTKIALDSANLRAKLWEERAKGLSDDVRELEKKCECLQAQEDSASSPVNERTKQNKTSDKEKLLEEVTKILTTNLQTLESKCTLLQAENKCLKSQLEVAIEEERDEANVLDDNA